MDNNLPTEFDLIVVGTGLVESIVSAAASRVGKRVLHIDDKSYYGGHWASFNLEDFGNLETEVNSVSEKNSHECLEKPGELFKTFGNELRNLRNFQTNWNVVEKVPRKPEHLESESHNKDQGEKENEKESGTHGDIKDDAKQEESDATEVGEHHQESEEPNVLTRESLKKDYRKFVIDLCPKLHFARGAFVELLISSNIARYSEFRSVSRVLTWINGNIEVVPCSRSDVFANNKVSVVEKRMLMKLLTSIEEDEKNSTVPTQTTYRTFLKNKKLSDNIIHFVLYALSMSTDETLWSDGLKSTKRFLHSLGRFGKTPFLFSMYGSGEIAQAFCRLSAVFGGIFALNQPLHGFLLNSDNIFQSLICGEQRITAPHLVLNVGMVPPCFLAETEVDLISRAVLITDKSLMESEREHLTLLLFPQKNNKLCRILELGTLTGTCPKNLFLVHITAPGTSDPRGDLQDCIEKLFSNDGESLKPKIIWSSYFSIPDTNNQKFQSNLPKNIFACPGPDTDLDYDFSVNKAKEIFSSIYPDEEFLPRAPDAEEIVIEEEPETASEARVIRNDDSNTIEVEIGSEEIKEQSSCAEVEVGSEEIKEESSCTEVAVEAKASAELNTNQEEEVNKEVEECSEVKEVAH